MDSLHAVLAEQEALMHAIKSTLSNLKKLGKEKMHPAIVQRRLTKLEDDHQKCRRRHGALVAQCDSKVKASLTYFVEDHFAAAEADYNEAADYMAVILHDAEATTRNASPNKSHVPPARPVSRLPKIGLPTFDGSFDRWERFRDTFTSMVHRDETLSDVDRMHYLLSCVRGDALDALNGLNITEANFRVGWEMLVSRFEHKNRLVSMHIDTLNNLPAVTSQNARELRRLRDAANNAITSLRNLGRQAEGSDDYLVYFVLRKLPQAT